MPNKDITFPAKTIAKLLDLTTARVGQLAKEGVIVKLESGRYPANAIPQYIRWLREKSIGRGVDNSGNGLELDLQQERAKLAKEQRKKTRLQNEELEGVLVNAEELKEDWIKYISSCRAKLLSLPTKLAPLVLPLTTTQETQDVIKKGVHEALDELAGK